MKLHHLGYLVQDMQDALRTMTAFGGGIAGKCCL